MHHAPRPHLTLSTPHCAITPLPDLLDHAPLSPHSDFDEMERMFSLDMNPQLDLEELEAMATEFRNDYNQRHFVRNETFKGAAEKITGECPPMTGLAPLAVAQGCMGMLP